MKEERVESKVFGHPSYGITRMLGKMSIEEARPAVEQALKSKGFGILTEIDVKATLHKKIGVDVNPYLILGACNPGLAHQALQAELPIGLLLPCNVVLSEGEDGLSVSAIDPVAMFEVVGREDVKSLALEVKKLLTEALEGLAL